MYLYAKIYNMKNSIFLIAFFLFTFIFNTQAQFEGLITYEISYTEMPAELKGQEAMLPKNIFVYYKNELTMVDQSMGMMGQMKVIANAKENSTHMYMNMMGSKYIIKMDNTQETDDLKYSVLDGTESILGYKCQKIMYKTDEGESMTLYYTKEIPAAKANQNFKGIDGTPLKYSLKANGMTMMVIAKSVEKKKIDKSNFELPKDVEVMTYDEFQKKMGLGF